MMLVAETLHKMFRNNVSTLARASNIRLFLKKFGNEKRPPQTRKHCYGNTLRNVSLTFFPRLRGPWTHVNSVTPGFNGIHCFKLCCKQNLISWLVKIWLIGVIITAAHFWDRFVIPFSALRCGLQVGEFNDTCLLRWIVPTRLSHEDFVCLDFSALHLCG